MKKIFLLVFVLCMFEGVSAAHFIVGEVKDSYDGEIANGKEVVLWNPGNGIDDNLTDIIGTTGNSGTDNVYMIDCELLNAGCQVGDEIKVRLVYDGQEVNLSVTGAGFDVFPNITVNSKPNVTSILVDDSITSPSQQVDLIAASTRTVTCQAVVEDYDGEPLQNHFSEFYSTSQGSPDNNNSHYTNNSCYSNISYGSENETQFICEFEVWYYANPGSWTCFFNVEDKSVAENSTNTTTINTLLSVGVQNTINYTVSSVEEVSDEEIVNVTNYGNVMVNLSLASYGNLEGDGLAMDCGTGNISYEHQKYNLTDSNSGSLDLAQADLVYLNMSNKAVIKEFNLDYRKGGGDSINNTYWRIYAPSDINGECTGYIVFGASQDTED